MKTAKTQRIIKVFIDDKHRKSFPLYMENYVNLIPAEQIDKMSKGMRLNDSDHIISHSYVYDKLVSDYLEVIKKQEPYAYDAVKRAKPVGTRKINNKHSEGYFELYFHNNISMKCPEYIFKYSVNKMPELNRNY